MRGEPCKRQYLSPGQPLGAASVLMREGSTPAWAIRCCTSNPWPPAQDACRGSSTTWPLKRSRSAVKNASAIGSSNTHHGGNCTNRQPSRSASNVHCERKSSSAASQSCKRCTWVISLGSLTEKTNPGGTDAAHFA